VTARQVPPQRKHVPPQRKPVPPRRKPVHAPAKDHPVQTQTSGRACHEAPGDHLRL